MYNVGKTAKKGISAALGTLNRPNNEIKEQKYDSVILWQQFGQYGSEVANIILSDCGEFALSDKFQSSQKVNLKVPCFWTNTKTPH